ncbi:type III restriction enzyme [Kribbella sp. VKM Ac-2571]|uniref:DEAD/DEAH box helicase n=1 Tax=Kribbella sp. VKM Ac-2571 TaxID=2512222 RepID=UPI00105B9713|nr:hypothetical protein [Kribbella sp. VKM Ac-2571]TDO57352.1 type III restriction enzyme [Kribbella sp. VKM Ac-2571]
MIELLQFQSIAASQISDRYLEYVANPVEAGRKNNKRVVPFYQALSALTGAGKTPILAQAVREICEASAVAPVVLWLSKGKVVVDQSFANLASGGKYHHLLGQTQVRLLSEYDPDEVEHSSLPMVYFATVGTFNQRDKETGSLRIYRSELDTTERSTWDALKDRRDEEGVRRPLIVVYDEAQNLSDLQTDLLLEQEPTAFLLASATLSFPARFSTEVIDELQREGFEDSDLITAVQSTAVVESGLVKGVVSLGGYNSPMEETINDMIEDFREAEADALAEGVNFAPKAIYVCNTNMLADDARRRDDPKRVFSDRQAPPILIWRYLTETCGVPSREIAVYADLAVHKDFPLPSDFVLFKNGDKDYQNFTAGNYRHIIFNLALQEGWDDPAAYFAYIDKSMESRIQVTQVIGRVLRQPGATHYASQRLNTAHFYVRVDRNEVFNDVLKEVRRGLGGDAPAVRILTTAPGRERPVEFPVKSQFYVPRAAVDNSDAAAAVEGELSAMSDYSFDLVNTSGVGNRRVVLERIGSADSEDADWEIFQQSNRVSARWIFRREVARRYNRAVTVMDTGHTKFDARVGVNSPAYSQIVDIAQKAVDTYLDYALIRQVGPNPYEVRSILARQTDIERFRNSIHDGYDGLNQLELDFAQALDGLDLPWCRNPSRLGYGLPLLSLGPTENFYPDFLLWSNKTVVCIDTKGEDRVQTDAARKLMSIAPHARSESRLRVALVSKGQWKPDGSPAGPDGITVWSLRADQKLRTIHHPDMASAARALADLGETKAS